VISKVLVANRGEIAIRAFRAAYELGIGTVAVYPYEDRNSLHRLKADESYQIGAVGHPVRAYLSVGEIVDTARRSGADAIYPGYGFLSENPELAASCADAGITFVGPSAEVLELTGNKSRAVAAARSLRRRELARIGSADLLGMLDVIDVCKALTSVWVAVLQAALEAMIRATLPEDGKAPAAIAVIGMGRLGGAELGYGSDADVLFVCEPAAGAEDSAAVRWAVSVAEQVRALLGTASADPPLEIDANLRPEGRSGPLVRTLGSYAAYYEQWAQPWEIQALLRAHAVAGDEDLGQRFMLMADKTRYPSDGVSAEAVREIRRIKARVESERLPRGADPNTHTKLGRGGLADIEWTVQLLQLQHAHEVPALHNTSTLESLDAIAAADLIPEADAELLGHAWLTATRARNALVLVRGKPTDQLPGPGRQLNAVAVAAGWRTDDGSEFLDNYLRVTRRAKAVVRKVFGS